MCLVEMGRRENYPFNAASRAARCILGSHKKVLKPRMTHEGIRERIQIVYKINRPIKTRGKKISN